jgi:hypothetical protein
MLVAKRKQHICANTRSHLPERRRNCRVDTHCREAPEKARRRIRRAGSDMSGLAAASLACPLLQRPSPSNRPARFPHPSIRPSVWRRSPPPVAFSPILAGQSARATAAGRPGFRPPVCPCRAFQFFPNTVASARTVLETWHCGRSHYRASELPCRFSAGADQSSDQALCHVAQVYRVLKCTVYFKC